MSKINVGERLSERSTRAIPTDKSYAERNRRRLERLKAEPKVKVYGNPLYKTYLGDVYSFDYQDFPVSISFNGAWHEYPKTIAELLMKKLDAAAMNHVPKQVGDGDKL